MMKALKLKRRQAGTEIVEFAIILPLLLLVMFGVMEFGLVLYDKALITNASREAARSGIAYKCPALTTQQITDVVTHYTEDTGGHSFLVSFGSSATPVVTVTPTPPATTINCGANLSAPLTVTVTYSYTFLVFGNLISLFASDFTNPINLSATTVMYYE